MAPQEMTQDPEEWLKMLEDLFDQEGQMTEKQKKILQAAIEIFAEKGYAATSTSEIAKKAGVAEGTIFRHYSSKEKLLLAIVAPTLAKIIAPFLLLGIKKTIQSPYEHLEDYIRAFLHDRIQFAKKNEKLIRIFLQELPYQSELKKSLKELIGKEVIRLIEKVLRHFQEKGEVRDDLPLQAIILHNASVGIGYILAHLYFLDDMPWDEKKETEWVIELLMHGISKPKG